jgi:DNA repair protein RadC
MTKGGVVEDENAGYRITDLKESERPRERLAKKGPGSLGEAELLAILIRTGLPGENAVQIGYRLLQTFGGLRGLHRASYEDIKLQKGIGPAKAAQLKSAIELADRMSSEDSQEKPKINSPQDAAERVMFKMGALDKEELWVMILDTRNRVLKIEELYRGSINSSQVRVAEIFSEAVKLNAASIIVIHNHPTGDPNPSTEDITLTRSLVDAGRLLDIDVLDHLVIGDNKFVSMKERGLGFR